MHQASGHQLPDCRPSAHYPSLLKCICAPDAGQCAHFLQALVAPHPRARITHCHGQAIAATHQCTPPASHNVLRGLLAMPAQVARQSLMHYGPRCEVHACLLAMDHCQYRQMVPCHGLLPVRAVPPTPPATPSVTQRLGLPPVRSAWCAMAAHGVGLSPQAYNARKVGHPMSYLLRSLLYTLGRVYTHFLVTVCQPALSSHNMPRAH